MKKSFASVIFFALLGSASAADITPVEDPMVVNIDQSAPAQPTAERWAGLYGGIAIGQGYLEDSAPAKADDTIYGGFAGYNLQWGPVVIGAEVSGEKADIMFTDGSTIASKFMYGARLRGGLANEHIFAYGSVGVQHGVTNQVPAIGLLAPMNEDTALQLGAGVDVALSQNLALGLDYTYTKYKKFGGFVFFGNTVDVETKKILVRLSYKLY